MTRRLCFELAAACSAGFGCAVVPEATGAPGPSADYAAALLDAASGAGVATDPGQRAVVAALGALDWAYLVQIDWAQVEDYHLVRDEVTYRALLALSAVERSDAQAEGRAEASALGDAVEVLTECRGDARCDTPGCVLVILTEYRRRGGRITPPDEVPFPGVADPAAWRAVLAAHLDPATGQDPVCRAWAVAPDDAKGTCLDPEWRGRSARSCM